MTEYLAFLLALIASSGDIGFRFVQTLVQIYHGIEGFMNTILGLDYQAFWVIVMLLIAAFFGWLLYRIGTKIGQVADALVTSNKIETEWQNFANEFDRETEDQVEDALDEKLK
jgi:hypothetical protein